MTTALLPVPIFRAFTSGGTPLAGGLLYTYLANTTTAATTWSDAAGTTPNANPVVLDSTGSATVRLDPTLAYKFVLKDSGGATQWTEDYYQFSYLTAAASVLTYGAKGDGIADDTTGIQAACATGRPVYFPAGTYNVSSMISLITPNQYLYGDGINSIIFATSGFNVAQQGVFNFTAGGNDDGPWFENMHFSCDQSVVASAGTRANLIQYPAALFLRNAPRFRVLQCRFEHFLIGIDAQGLSAGFVLDSVDMCTYMLGCVINGSGDTVRFKDYHYTYENHWSANQIAIWGDGNNTGLATGRNDGIDISDSAFLGPGYSIISFTGTGLSWGATNYPTVPGVYGNTYTGSGLLTGNTKAQIVNSGFDTAATLVQNAVGSTITIANSYFSNGAGSANQIQLTAGAVTIMGGFTQSSVVPSVPYFSINNTSGSLAEFTLGGGFMLNIPAGSGTIIAVAGSALSLVNICNNYFLISPGAGGPMLTSTGANVRLTFCDNQFAATTQTANLALSIDTDNSHVITGNAFNGWSIAVPPNAAIASASQTVANPGVFTTAVQAWSAGQPVYITGTAPGGFSNGVIYYVIAGGLTTTAAELAATVGGAGIQCTASSSCNLVPIGPTAYTKAIIANNSTRGVINFNNANIRALAGNAGSATVAAASTVYLGPGGYANAAVSVNTFHIPKAGNIVGFQVKTNGGAVGAQTFTYTVYQNGTATAMTGSITASQTVLNVTTNFFAVAAADRIELQLVTSATAAATNHTFSILFEPA